VTSGNDSDRPPWEAWRQELAESLSLADLRSRLTAAGHTVSHLLPRGSVARAQWLELGVRVLSKCDLPTHGSCMYQLSNSIVLVRSSKNYPRQRFTTAHEVGHLLLGRVRDKGHITFDTFYEERLCDEFASAALLPSDEVRAFLGDTGHLESPTLVLKIAKHFGVNIQPVVIALGRIWTDDGRLLMVADVRGHSRRPDEIDYRVLANAGRPYEYIPPQQRLRSLGLGGLVDWAQTGPVDKAGHGRSEQIRVPFWSPEGPFRTGWLLGEATWDAIVLPNRVMIALFGLDRTAIRWNRPRGKGSRSQL
jgi:hypothetical protein